MSNYNNVNRVLVGDGANSGTITSLPTIQKGDLILLDEKGNVISTNTAAAALPKFEKVKIAVGIGPGKAILSSPIQGNTVSAYEGSGFRAPAEQVSFLGFNGTAGTGLVVSATNEYRLRIEILDDHRFNGQRQTFSDFHYSAGDSATAGDAVTNIVCMYDQKDYVDAYMQDKVKLEILTDGTLSAFAEDATVVTGNPVVSFAGNVTVASNSWVRIQGVDYQVKKGVSGGTSITLFNTYKGVSETIASGGTAGTLSTPTEFGFKMTAIPQDALLSRNANEPWDQYEWVVFKAYFSESDDRSFDSMAVYTEDTKVDPGNGFWKQVAEREEEAKGYLGDTSKRRFHDTRIDSNVVAGTSYDSIVITHADVHRGDFQGLYNAPLQTEIYIPDGADQGLGTGNNFVHILNGFFGTKLGFSTISL